MQIEFDPEKREHTIQTRGLDMADAVLIFESDNLTFENNSKDFGEPRFMTVGFLQKRMIILVWTMRGDKRRIISMRKANDREKTLYSGRMD
jgi:uncharacterized protein